MNKIRPAGEFVEDPGASGGSACPAGAGDRRGEDRRQLHPHRHEDPHQPIQGADWGKRGTISSTRKPETTSGVYKIQQMRGVIKIPLIK